MTMLADHNSVHTVEELTPLIVGMLGIAVSLLAAFWARKSSRGIERVEPHAETAAIEATGANDAVNNIHEDEPKLYDRFVALEKSVEYGFDRNDVVQAELRHQIAPIAEFVEERKRSLLPDNGAIENHVQVLDGLVAEAHRQWGWSPTRPAAADEPLVWAPRTEP